MAINTYLNDIIDHQNIIDQINYNRLKGMINSAKMCNDISVEEYTSLMNKLNNKIKK